jgi:hypothetical protein
MSWSWTSWEWPRDRGKYSSTSYGPLIGEIKYYNLQSVRRDPLSTTYGGRSELGSRNLGNNDETGESIQVWTGQRRNKVLQSVNPDPPHVREKSELGSRNRVHRDNNQVITGHRGQMLQYYEKGIVLREVIQFTEEIWYNDRLELKMLHTISTTVQENTIKY